MLHPFIIHKNRCRRGKILKYIRGETAAEIHILGRIVKVGHLQQPFKANHLRDFIVHHPHQIHGAAYADHGGRGFHLKGLLLKFHQVFGEYLELTGRHPEFGVSFFFGGIKLKLVEMEIRLFTHGHVASVFEGEPEPGVLAAFDPVVEEQQHPCGRFQRF